MKRIAFAVIALYVVLAFGWAGAESVLTSSKTTLEGSSKNKITNVKIAIAAIDETVVNNGDYFSFNDTVGPRSASYGYKSAPNGRGVKVIGGGVAQVASTMYLSLKKLDGIRFDERATYANFTENYVANKKNAIMVDYKAGQDFSFYNETGSDVRIDVWTSDNYVHCSLVALDSAKAAFDGITMYVPDDLVGNVSLACDSIYDTSLENGDSFSFNAVVGPRTARCGFEKGVNGMGASVMGGGVDMVASAVYMAVKNMDCVEVTDKTTYRSFNQSYVSDKADAVYVNYGDKVDFGFTYTGWGILSVYAYVDGNTLYCEVNEFL